MIVLIPDHCLFIYFVNLFFIDLPSIFRDKSINRYNHPYQIISRIMKYQSFVINIINLRIWGAIFNFNKLVSDLDIETCNPDF